MSAGQSKEQVLEQTKQKLGLFGTRLIPQDTVLREATVESFQSPTFRKACWHLEAGRENEADASLTRLTFSNGQEVIIMTNKRSNGPYAVAPHGVDFRKEYSCVILPGEGSTRVYKQPFDPTEKCEEYEDEAGKLTNILPQVRQQLGTQVGTITIK